MRTLILIAFILAGTIDLTKVSAQSTSTDIVYVTKTGEKYHKPTCHHLKQSKIKTTLKEAKMNGYDPCKVCKPKGYKSTSSGSTESQTRSTAVRCSGRTQSGNRCKRMTKNASGRCYQHQ